MKQQNKTTIDFEKIYDSYAPMLYRLALSNTTSREDAEDVVQDVFCKLMDHLDTFSNESHMRAWLVRVTINQSHDVIRRNGVRQYQQLDEMAEQLSKEDELPEIYEHLKQLPGKYRSVLVLHYLEGYNVREIAGMLRLTQSAIKMRLSRGRDLLKSLIVDI